jgi:hypothetical protein
VSTFAAPRLLRETDMWPNPVLRWWRKREPCPMCEDQMSLRGDEPGLLQGCDLHGFWIDADTVEHTGLSRGIDQDALRRDRDDLAKVEAHRVHCERLELERAARREAAAVLPTSPPRIDQVQADASREREQNRRDQLRGSIGAFATDYLLERLATLETKNAELEQRLAALEHR